MEDAWEDTRSCNRRKSRVMLMTVATTSMFGEIGEVSENKNPRMSDSTYKLYSIAFYVLNPFLYYV